jgi:putative ABC transport system substrate-binding protein
MSNSDLKKLRSFALKSSASLAVTVLLLTFLGAIFALPAVAAEGQSLRIAVLTIGDVRKSALDGFMDAMRDHGEMDNSEYFFEVKDAHTKRAELPALADEIVASRPDLIIAAGGLEADALKKATAENRIPVVFLVVSSSVERGLVASRQQPGGNMTGIDTNDTALTEKRLWYINKLLPAARRVLSLNVPAVTPSAESILVAKQTAPHLGLEFSAIDVTSAAEIKTAAANISRKQTDVLLLNPCAPVSQALKPILLPVSLEQKIPIFGYSGFDINNGAVAIYGPSRYGIGRQGARLAIKILHGSSPASLPVETPEELELIINRHMVERLELKLPSRLWKLANRIENIVQ